MTRQVQLASPDQTLAEVAQVMADLDVGILPVGENDRLVGMISDRDIAVRGVAMGRGPQTAVRDVMSQEIRYCYDDQLIDDVARNMGDIQVRRLPVLDRDKRLVGIISLGDIARDNAYDEESGSALRKISERGGEHTQTVTPSRS